MAEQPSSSDPKPLSAADFAIPPLPDPAEPPETCQDWDVHLRLTPEHHESIARSWSMEEAHYRHRNQRAQTLLSELAIHHIGNVKTTAKQVHELALSLADLKKHDVALDKVRAAVEIERIRAASRLDIERLRAQSRLDLEDRRHQNRQQRHDRYQKDWIARETLRQKNRLALEDHRHKNKLELTRLKIEAAKEVAAQKIEAAKAATPLDTSDPGDPYPPGARYGRDPKTGRPYTRAEFMKHLRYAVYDIYGLNLPGETNLDGTARDPDTYADRIDADGEYIETPEEIAERDRRDLEEIHRFDPTYRPINPDDPFYRRTASARRKTPADSSRRDPAPSTPRSNPAPPIAETDPPSKPLSAEDVEARFCREDNKAPPC